MFTCDEKRLAAANPAKLACSALRPYKEAADIGFEFARNIPGQAFNFDFAGDNLEDAALNLYAGGITESMHRHLNTHADVHRDTEKVHVEQIAADRVGEPVFENGGLMFAV